MANTELTHQASPLDTKARALIRVTAPSSARRTSASRKLARGLGWFGIALGAAELLAAGPLARAIGLRGHETLLRAFGVREIASGIGILASKQPATQATWVGARVAGDALDIAMLAAAVVAPRPRAGHPVVALFAVAGVALLDVVVTRALQQEANAARQTTDYSHRAGLGREPAAMRGAALETFKQPPDMRVSAVPLTNGAAASH